jgi:uncharacterized protein (TIGR03086 family)
LTRDNEAPDSEVADRYSTIASGFSARIEAAAGDGWSAPTPCPDWTTRDIVEHVIGVHQRVLAYLSGTETEASGPDDDLVEAWSESTAAMQDALRDPAVARTIVATPFGEMPFEDLVSRMVCSDTLVHTWDLARATGQDERLDSHAVEVAWIWMEPAGDRLRQSGAFGPAVTPPPDADTQRRLLCFLGRSA